MAFIVSNTKASGKPTILNNVIKVVKLLPHLLGQWFKTTNLQNSVGYTYSSISLQKAMAVITYACPKLS